MGFGSSLGILRFDGVVVIRVSCNDGVCSLFSVSWRTGLPPRVVSSM